MSTIDEILAHNKTFVEEKGYLKYSTDKYPDKKLAIVSCMDTRLTELLPAALGLKNGDAKIIKNAGGVISHPFGSVIRSLLVAVFELGVKTIMVVGHSNCGAQHMNSDDMICHMLNAGISQDHSLRAGVVESVSCVICSGVTAPFELVRKQYMVSPSPMADCGKYSPS